MRAALALAVLSILAAVAWLLAAPEPAGAPVALERPAAVADDPAELDGVAPPAAPAAQALAESLRPSSTAAAQEPSPDDEALVVEGRFRLLLPDGGADEGLSGEVTFVVWHPDSATTSTGTSQTLAVVDGRFRLDVLAADSLLVRELTLGGAAAVPLQPDHRHPVDQGPLLIEVRHVPPLVIHVTDAASGAHLDGVSLTVQPRKLFGVAAPGRPGATGERLVADATSPLTLRPPTSVAAQGWVTLDVRAPGHADGQLGLDPAAGGEHHLALTAGATLEIFVEGATPPDDAVLRLRRRTPDGPPTLERALDDVQPQVVEGLAPGHYHVQIDLGDWYDQPAVLAHETVMAAVGRRQRVVLTLDATLLPRPTRLSGSLVLPPYWRGHNDALRLARVGQRGLFGGQRSLPLADMQPVAGRDDLFLWDAGEVLTGRYELSLPRPHTAVLIDVGPDGVDDALLEVGPPGHLSVEIVDAHSGESLRDAALSWYPARPDGVGGFSENVLRDETSGLYELVAPVGEVQLAAIAPGVALDWTPATVSVGGGRVTLAARRQYDVVVLLDDGRQLLPVPGGLTALTFEPVDGSGQRVAFGQREGQAFITLDEPGRYRVVVPAPVGFAEIPPQVIEVGGPGVTRHVIELLPP